MITASNTLPSDLRDSVVRFRTARTATFEALALQLPMDFRPSIADIRYESLQWALWNHFYQAAVYGSKTSRPEEALDQLRVWSAPSLSLPNGPVAVPADLTIEVPVGAEMPSSLVSIDALVAADGAESSETFRQAVDLLRSSPFWPIIHCGVGIAVLLKKRHTGGPSSSWATTALPGTVYSDWYTDPALLAKDLVHEATHSLLNDLLSARQVELDDKPKYFSPWKATMRPIYGFVHSVAAFSQMTNFLSYIQPTVVDRQAGIFVDEILRRERKKLRAVEVDVQRAFDGLNDVNLSHWLNCTYRDAIED